MLFKLKGTKVAVGIFMESPLYQNAPLKERKMIVTRFMEQYLLTEEEKEDRRKKNDKIATA